MHTNALDVRWWERTTQKDDDAATFFFSVMCFFAALLHNLHSFCHHQKLASPKPCSMTMMTAAAEKVLSSSSLRIVCWSVVGRDGKVFYHRHFILNLLTISHSFSSHLNLPHNSSSAYTRSTFSDKQQQLTSDIIMKSQKSSMETREKSLQHIVWQWICEWMEMIQPPRGVCCADFFALYRVAAAAVISSQCCCRIVTVEPSTECAVWREWKFPQNPRKY